ncbi:MAG: APC family permease, partial [Burkholderiales bacterium]
AQFNAVMVLVKVAAILLFLAVAIGHLEPSNWTPFIPALVTDPDGATHFGWPGVLTGAATIFFAYIGFDAVSTAAEECENPQRDLPIGILGSLAVCTVLYIVVSGVLTGIVPYTELKTASPVASALLKVGEEWAAGLIAIGAIAGLTTVMLVLYFAITRILFAISRDGLLPPFFSHISERTKSPVRVIVMIGAIMCGLAGFLPLDRLAELTNIGTLGAFVVVCAGVITLRRTHPDMARGFRTPFGPVIPLLGIGFCLWLMASLRVATWQAFGVWLIAGLVVYFSYSMHHSKLAGEATRPLV